MFHVFHYSENTANLIVSSIQFQCSCFDFLCWSYSVSLFVSVVSFVFIFHMYVKSVWAQWNIFHLLNEKINRRLRCRRRIADEMYKANRLPCNRWFETKFWNSFMSEKHTGFINSNMFVSNHKQSLTESQNTRLVGDNNVPLLFSNASLISLQLAGWHFLEALCSILACGTWFLSTPSS